MTREQMIDKVVRARGHEDIHTINFCLIAEDKRITDDTLISIMDNLMLIQKYSEESYQ